MGGGPHPFSPVCRCESVLTFLTRGDAAEHICPWFCLGEVRVYRAMDASSSCKFGISNGHFYHFGYVIDRSVGKKKKIKSGRLQRTHEPATGRYMWILVTQHRGQKPQTQETVLICPFQLMTSSGGAYLYRDVTQIRPQINSLTVKAGAL